MDSNGEDSFGDNANGDKQQELYLVITYVCVAAPLGLCGLVGNTISFWIFGKMMHQNATTFLLRALAVIDSCGLLIVAPYSYCSLSIVYGNDWIRMPNGKLWHYVMICISPIYRIFLLVNAWTSVIIGMNRYIVVCHLLQAARLCTISHARKQITWIILLSSVYSLPRFFEYRSITDGVTVGYTIVSHGNTWYFYIYIVGCDIMFRFLLPLGMLMYFCIRLIVILRVARRHPMNRHNGRDVDASITSMLVILLGIFLVCQSPNILSRILDVFIARGVHSLCPWNQTVIIYMSPTLIIFNSSINCLIYIAYINQFRQMLSEGYTHPPEQNHDYELT